MSVSLYVVFIGSCGISVAVYNGASERNGPTKASSRQGSLGAVRHGSLGAVGLGSCIGLNILSVPTSIQIVVF